MKFTRLVMCSLAFIATAGALAPISAQAAMHRHRVCHVEHDRAHHAHRVCRWVR